MRNRAGTTVYDPMSGETAISTDAIVSGEIKHSMPSPPTRCVPVDLIAQLVRGARECAEDIIAEADAKYPEAQRAEQPSSARRHARDVATALTTLELVFRFETEFI